MTGECSNTELHPLIDTENGVITPFVPKWSFFLDPKHAVDQSINHWLLLFYSTGTEWGILLVTQSGFDC